MARRIMRFAVELELDDTVPEMHPDSDEVVLQIERALLENAEEFGIITALAQPVEGDWRIALQQAFNKRRRQEEGR